MGQGNTQALGFRPEIEGLRAVAVIAVIAGHAEIKALAGGYLGVDVFFVISGYLIARRMAPEMAAGSFSLLNFYERRARRILPALLLVLACSTPLAIVVLVSQGLENFGQSLFASVLFSNNVMLTLTSDYWSHEAAFKPLLHTWSLGVEEQFYLLLPFLLWPIAPMRKWARLTLCLFLVVSLVGGHYLAKGNPPASFYLLPTRAWELLAGILIAVARVRIADRLGLLSLAGLTLIIVAMVTGREGSPHPSLGAVGVVAATALLLACDAGRSASAAFLGARPLVMIGASSYALYLWHQPLFAFLRVLSTAPPPSWQYALLVPVLVLLAALTVRLEARYRDPRLVPTPRFLRHMVLGGGALAAIGLFLHFSHGLPGRHEATRGVKGLDPASYNARVYQFASLDDWRGDRTRILLVGNSRARDFGNVLIEAGALQANSLLYRETLPICTPSGLGNSQVAQADILIVETGMWTRGCADLLAQAGKDPRRVFVLGPREFAHSIEPYLTLGLADRADLRVPYLPGYERWNRDAAADAAPASYVDYYRLLSADGNSLPLFDSRGKLITSDRVHLTKAGAKLIAERLTLERAFHWMHSPGSAGAPSGR